MRRATNREKSDIHCHTEGSNLRFLDSTNKTDALIKYAFELGNGGVAITDHECLCSHITAIETVDKLKSEGKMDEDFKLILGNEIYLVDKQELRNKRENNEKLQFYHLILLAKDLEGHRQLRQLSSRAWKFNYFNYRGIQRVPTYYSDVEEIIGDNKGHLVCSTACLGSYLGKLSILLFNEQEEEKQLEIKNKMLDFIDWCQEWFPNDFYLEIQPSQTEEQIEYNKLLINISKGYNVPLVVATDVHYLSEKERNAHKAFLTSDSEDGTNNREVDAFYGSTKFFSVDELYEAMSDYIEEDTITKAILNTNKIKNKILDYKDWFRTQTIPLTPLPPREEWFPIDLKVVNRFSNIKTLYEDKYEHHTYLIHQIFRGINYRKIPIEDLEEIYERVDTECSELNGISEKMGQPVGAYLTTMQKNMDLIWEVSIIGAGRGSAVGWATNYLLNITQINPLRQEGMKLQHWRFLTADRPEMPKQHWANVVNLAYRVCISI